MPVEIHFLNVGHGDCTYVEHDSGRLTMIDINNSKTLPEADEQALAEASGVPLAVFKGAGVVHGKLSWEDYSQSLLVDPYEYFEGKLKLRTCTGMSRRTRIWTICNLSHSLARIRKVRLIRGAR